MHMLAQPRVWPTFLLAQLGLFLMLFTRFWQRGAETSLALQNPIPTPSLPPILPIAGSQSTPLTLSIQAVASNSPPNRTPTRLPTNPSPTPNPPLHPSTNPIPGSSITTPPNHHNKTSNSPHIHHTNTTAETRLR